MNRIRLAGTAAAAALTLAFAAGAAELVADPPVLVFDNQDMSIPVTLRDGSDIVSDPAVEKVSFMVDDSDYSHMISVTAGAQGLIVKPTDYLEVGSYDLIVQTNAGTAHLEVYSPLREMQTGLEKQAEAMGISVDELKARLGMKEGLQLQRIDLGLAPVYYAGETVKLQMSPDPGVRYLWTVNGEEVAAGTGPHIFEHTFAAPGDYVITYSEEKEGIVSGSAIEAVAVVDRLAAHHRVHVGDSVELKAPAGYNLYQWKINGLPVEGSATTLYTFEKPGRYTVEVIAEDPATAEAEGRQVLTYTYVAEDL
ncbi:MAG: PKD domain-containing protein [Candidatus Hydrogenedentes bacterium]|nr:PKD domain-containing protein [Candidatus Hydrogenedentota bacterium]